MKHVAITAGFAIITTGQLVLGVLMVTLAGIKGGEAKLLCRGDHIFRALTPCVVNSPVAEPQPPIPLDVYHLCVFVQPRTVEVVYTSISLSYGAFNPFQTST